MRGISLGEEAVYYFLGEAEREEQMGSTVERWDRMKSRQASTLETGILRS